MHQQVLMLAVLPHTVHDSYLDEMSEHESVSELASSGAQLKRHPDYPSLGHELERPFRRAPTYEDYYPGRHCIAGCVIYDGTLEGE